MLSLRFDVIEYIAKDLDELKNIQHGLKGNGICFSTVPQNMWLWSDVDVEACHQRRYTAAELHQKLKLTGFQILSSASFIIFLLPLVMFARPSAKLNSKGKTSVGLGLSPALDKILEAIMLVDWAFFRLGITLPIRESWPVIARKTTP
jgi:hypothetical protein